MQLKKELVKELQAVCEAAEEYLEVDSYGQNVEITDTKRKALQRSIEGGRTCLRKN